MKSLKRGKSISAPEVLNVSVQGIWLLVADREYFLPYDQYPWFKDGTIAQIHNVQQTKSGHLRWADLDIDLDIASLEYPAAYPLVYQD